MPSQANRSASGWCLILWSTDTLLVNLIQEDTERIERVHSIRRFSTVKSPNTAQPSLQYHSTGDLRGHSSVGPSFVLYISAYTGSFLIWWGVFRAPKASIFLCISYTEKLVYLSKDVCYVFLANRWMEYLYYVHIHVSLVMRATCPTAVVSCCQTACQIVLQLLLSIYHPCPGRPCRHNIRPYPPWGW